MHFCVARGTTPKHEDNEALEFTGFVDALTAVEQTHDFIVVDTAGSDNHLTRLAHSMADTLITPLNDSFVDFAVLGTVDPATYTVTGESHYAKMVREARQQRRLVDGVQMDWVVLRNRLSMLNSRNKRRIVQGLSDLAARLGFRSTDALAERVIYREFFPRGLTALDQLDEKTLGTRPSLAHVTARQELTRLDADPQAAARRAPPAARHRACRMGGRARHPARARRRHCLIDDGDRPGGTNCHTPDESDASAGAPSGARYYRPVGFCRESGECAENRTYGTLASAGAGGF